MKERPCPRCDEARRLLERAERELEALRAALWLAELRGAEAQARERKTVLEVEKC